MLARRASPVVVLLLLASVATASAECAWVLRQRETAVSSSVVDENPWQLLRAVPTYDTCESAHATAIKNIAALWAQRHGASASVGDSTIIVSMSGVSWTQHFRCLPDTVDPRGPKGK
jgi:hypothetical protein